MKFFVLFLTLVMAGLSFAEEFEGGIHTPNFCSVNNAKTCAHLKFEKFPNSFEESKFIVHILSESGIQVEKIKVKLWMQSMGHGSSPVTVEATDELNHFFVQEGYFLMTGPWQVVVTFTDNGVEQKIIIPLEIKE